MKTRSLGALATSVVLAGPWGFTFRSMQDGGKVRFVSDPSTATGVIFRETAADHNYDFHTAPRRQYVVNLDGAEREAQGFSFGRNSGVSSLHGCGS